MFALFSALSLVFAESIVPVASLDSFLDLKYKKLKPNQVELKIGKPIRIEVNQSASPLFFKGPRPMKLDKVYVTGQVEIKKEIDPLKDDSYFQLGIVFQGEYRPSSISKWFLPEWILTLLKVNSKYGIGDIHFFDVAPFQGQTKSQALEKGDIKIFVNPGTVMNKENRFMMTIDSLDKTILSFWLRADGDDSKGSFVTTIDRMEYHLK